MHRTAPHRTALHAPHGNAPHRAAPHARSLRARVHTRICMYTMLVIEKPPMFISLYL